MPRLAVALVALCLAPEAAELGTLIADTANGQCRNRTPPP